MSLTALEGSNVVPVNNTTALRQSLQDAVAMNGYPDIAPPDILSRLTGGLLGFQLAQRATVPDSAGQACREGGPLWATCLAG